MSETTETTVGSDKSAKMTPKKASEKTKRTGEKSSKKPKPSQTKALKIDNENVLETKEKKTKNKKSASTRKKTVDFESFALLQEQIATNQRELLDNISEVFQNTLNTQLKRADHRRRWNNFFRDLIIVVLALGLGYTGHLLYSLGYRIDNTDVVENSVAETETATDETNNIEPVKDEAWYLANYSYLLDRVKTDLNADGVSAYYLYSGDHTLNDIKPEYLLSMAYRRFSLEQADNANIDTSNNSQHSEVQTVTQDGTVSLPVSALKTTFATLFGETAKFSPTNFNAGCLSFSYQRASETFEAQNQTCALNQHREIVENIEKIYQEGEVVYIVTRAGIYDKDEQSFYNFNDLFHSVAENVKIADFDDYKDQLNRYQYQFNKSGNELYFRKITKLN